MVKRALDYQACICLVISYIAVHAGIQLQLRMRSAPICVTASVKMKFVLQSI